MGSGIQSGSGTATRLPGVVSVPRLARHLVEELVSFLRDPGRGDPDQYEVVETRLEGLKGVVRSIEEQLAGATDDLRAVQHWFREATNPLFFLSGFGRRIRTWPEGHPGDCMTLEQIYRNEPSSEGIGGHLDRYLLSRTLAVAVRSRMRMLSRLLRDRARVETGRGNWLNLGCGSCRELLALDDDSPNRTIYLVDTDRNALEFSRNLLAGKKTGAIKFLAENPLRFLRAERNLERFGPFSTIYSAGLFDYLDDSPLARLLGGLYRSLADGGLLIASFNDKTRYDTFDYHWLSQWHFFLQRAEPDYRALLAEAGIPDQAVRMERDDTGVILFFLITKSAAPPAAQDSGSQPAEQDLGGPVWRVDPGNQPNEESPGHSHEEDERILGLLDEMLATAEQVNRSISNLCSRTAQLRTQCVSVLSESPE